jgi:hypothetical protein
MSDVLQFELNQPQEVAIRYTEPKVFDGQYGERCMFSLTDGRVMYVDPLTAARIKSLGVTPGEVFYIQKAKNGRLTEWSVFRDASEVPPPAPKGPIAFGGTKKTYKPLPDLVDSVAARNAARSEGSDLEDQLKASIDMVQRKKLEAKLNGAVPAAAVSEFTARLLQEANALIDAYASALQTASTRHGNAVKPEDVRSLLVTAYISASKQRAA